MTEFPLDLCMLEEADRVQIQNPDKIATQLPSPVKVPIKVSSSVQEADSYLDEFQFIIQGR